jgi:hypothetical protein
MSSQINNKLCPYVKNPFSACYCFNLNSRNINPAIHYCSDNYKSCEIFKKELTRDKPYEKNIQK